MFQLKKSLAIILILSLVLTSAFVACGKKNKGKGEAESATVESASGIAGDDTEIDFVEIDVTDKNGEPVTDEDGKVKTEEVPVVVKRDKDGRLVAYKLDKSGNPTDETIPGYNQDPTTTTTKGGNKTTTTTTTKKKTTKKSTTVKPSGGEKTTAPEPTTKKGGGVPKTSDSGTPVIFSDKDQQNVKKILEVPYLYKASYENANGVPINIATHAALWMAEKDGLQPTTFASGTIVLGLFKYFGQTVVNFKGQCNSAGDNENIQYNTSNGTFVVSAFEEQKQEVSITKIEDMGNNYFKITGSVTNADGKTKVVAILQKNKLDLSLGFSVKALKWS